MESISSPPETESQFSSTATDETPIETHSDDDFEEMELFEKVHPLKALCKMSIGPLVSQVSIALAGVVNSVWVAQLFGQNGTAALGNVGVIEFIPNAVAAYLSTCISAQISYLFGIGQKQKTPQLYVDFVRICMIFGIILPAILVPLSPILLRWYGAPDNLIESSYHYLLFPEYGSFFYLLFQMNCGLLEVMGKYKLYALIQIFSFVLNCGILDPFFLLVLKTPLWGVSLASFLSQAIPGIVLTFIIFKGHYSVKPRLSMLFNKFEKETFSGLGAGISDAVEYLSYDIPIIFFLKYLGSAANKIGIYEEAMTVMNGINKIEQVNQAICFAIGEGLLPLCSFAFGFKNYNRIFWLMIHATWIMILWTGIISLFIVFSPRLIASIWGNSDIYLTYAGKMIWIYGLASWMTSLQFVYPQIMIATKHKISAAIYSLVSLIFPIPFFSYILYKSNPADPTRLIWTFDITNLTACVIGAIFMIHPILVIQRGRRNSPINSEPLLNESTPSDPE